MTARSGATSADDPDRPLTDDEFERGRWAMRVRAVRERAGLAEAAFAARYRIPLATLRDWERGRVLPDAPARAYLEVIERIPDDVAAALSA
jgi:putative transcriptional regulator